MAGTLRDIARLRLPAGTQVVTRVAVSDRDGAARPAGSVGFVAAMHDVTLNAEVGLPFIGDLVGAKMAAEEATLIADDVAFHEGEVARLLAELESAAATSKLPETPSAGPALSDLLVRVRLATV